MSTTPRTSLLEALESLDASSTFCSAGSLSAILPGLEIAGVGPVSLPVSAETAQQIIGRATQAPYGHGQETIVDTAVRASGRWTQPASPSAIPTGDTEPRRAHSHLFVLWLAALLTPRPPGLMVLNEPETSLHPQLLPTLAELILTASRKTQVWVVTHSPELLRALQTDKRCKTVSLIKDTGETLVEGQSLLDKPTWHWPPR